MKTRTAPEADSFRTAALSLNRAGVANSGQMGATVPWRRSNRHRLKSFWIWWVCAAGSLGLALPKALALDPARDLLQYNCRSWSRQNGMPANKVSAITQTQNGYIWLGMQNGLVRFDGFEFKVIPVNLAGARGQEIKSLSKAKNGGLWFAVAMGGAGGFDGHNFFDLGSDTSEPEGTDPQAILELKDGSVWIGAVLGFGRWVKDEPGRNFFNRSAVGSVFALCEDAAGRVWMGTSENGLFCWSNNELKQIEDESLKRTVIYALASGLDGSIWVGTGEGLRCYDSEGKPRQITPLNIQVRALFVDSHGVLWIGTADAGVARYQDGQYSYLKKIEGLASDNVTSFFEDAEGSLWIGTLNGLSQLADVKLAIEGSQKGIAEGSIRSVFASRQGGVLLATNDGINYFDGKTAANPSGSVALPSRYVKRVFEARNGGLYLIDGNKNIDVLFGEPPLVVYPNQSWPTAFAEDRAGVVAAVGPALVRFENNQARPFEYADGVGPQYFWVNNLMAASDDSIWVASNNGLFRIKEGGFRQWSAADGLSGNRVQSLWEDEDGSIWLGLATGLARIKEGQVRNITPENGLYDNRIYSIVPDDYGFVWIDSGRGIFRVQLRKLREFADGKLHSIQCEPFDGSEAVKFTDRTDQEPSGCKTKDGRIWFPGPQGVVCIDPARIPVNEVMPPVIINRIRANGIDQESAAKIKPGKGELEFHFTALSFIGSQKIRFQYRLEGYDRDWVEAGDRRMAFYTNLKPGHYRFKVIAANADGVWNRSGDTLPIELAPRFVQTLWFYALCGAVCTGALAGIYLWRMRHLSRKQEVLRENRDYLQSEVLEQTVNLVVANTALQDEIEGHKHTEIQLKQRTLSLENEIEERNRMQLEIERVHRELLEISRRAGMAEVATSVLHNVGNVLNSVNVSASVIAKKVRDSRIGTVARTAELLQVHKENLGAFFLSDPAGQKLPEFLGSLAGRLSEEQSYILKELQYLGKNIEHIKNIVSMQQTYSKVSGVAESVSLTALAEDSLRMNEDSLSMHKVEVTREYSEVPLLMVEKHKVLQILINLIRNSTEACEASGKSEKRLIVRVFQRDEFIHLEVADNGLGILPENLTRIFSHGFTTKKQGHGFGLHGGALAAAQMGGTLKVRSDGLGQGATFSLELPLTSSRDAGVLDQA